MENDLKPVIAAMAGGTREPVGWFEYQVRTNSWTWSPGLYKMHGFEPGQIVPTTDIFAAHKHPDDRVHTNEVMATVLATGQPFCCRHRIVTSRREVRTVVTIGRGSLDAQGEVVAVHGYFVDITDASLSASRAETQDAVARSAATRADIEQAKGALMAVNGMTADDAFATLSWHSSHSNMKLRDVAQVITRGMTDPLTPLESPGQRISRLLASIVRDPGRPTERASPPGAAAR